MGNAFTDAEIEYLNGQQVGRIATVGADGMPHVVPVGVFYDPETEAIVIGSSADFGGQDGHEATMATTKKFRDAQRRPSVALVVDDPTPRFLEVRGRAETHTGGGAEIGRRLGAPFRFGPAWIRIRARRIVALGIDGGPFELSARSI